MRTIIRDILASPVPVATYVTPSGAPCCQRRHLYPLCHRHIAAMARRTNLGAATPVNLGPEDTPTQSKLAPRRRRARVVFERTDHVHKQINDSAAYIRGLANCAGATQPGAERAVREAVSLSAREALT